MAVVSLVRHSGGKINLGHSVSPHMVRGVMCAPHVVLWATGPKRCGIVKGSLPKVTTKLGLDPSSSASVVVPNTS